MYELSWHVRSSSGSACDVQTASADQSCLPPSSLKPWVYAIDVCDCTCLPVWLGHKGSGFGLRVSDLVGVSS